MGDRSIDGRMGQLVGRLVEWVWGAWWVGGGGRLLFCWPVQNRVPPPLPSTHTWHSRHARKEAPRGAYARAAASQKRQPIIQPASPKAPLTGSLNQSTHGHPPTHTSYSQPPTHEMMTTTRR